MYSYGAYTCSLCTCVAMLKQTCMFRDWIKGGSEVNVTPPISLWITVWKPGVWQFFHYHLGSRHGVSFATNEQHRNIFGVRGIWTMDSLPAPSWI